MEKFIIIDEKNLVLRTNYVPFDDTFGEHKTREELLQIGYFVDEIPIPGYKKGYITKQYFNPLTKKFSEEYVISEEKTEIELLQENVNSLGEQLAQEKLKNIQKDATISQLGQEIAKLKLEVINIKGGV